MRAMIPFSFFCALAAVGALAMTARPASAQGATANPEPLTPATFRDRMGRPGADKAALVEQTRAWFGADALKRGANPKVQNLTVAWAIEVPGVTAGQEPRVVSQDGMFTLPLARVGDSDIYAAVATLPEGDAFQWQYQAGGKAVGNWRQIEVYTTPSEYTPNPAVPQGKVTQMPAWHSKIFENTTRDWWVYVPAQYKPENPACVMVFQDGAGYRNRVPVVFDNMIAKSEMPVTIGIFINPGNYTDRQGSNRSIEYDTVSDKFARFLIDEILPEVGKTYKLRTDAAGRAIAGISSGGICAFTVAWERPDAFSKVVSGVGSFTNLQGGADGTSGGNTYPARIRKLRGWDRRGEPKPIRVFLTDGANDLDNAAGNWPLSNMQMAKALEYGGYDYKFLFGKGFHGSAYFNATLPDALRWIWRDEVKK